MPTMDGLHKKFTVIDNRTGEEVDEFTFTLKPESDPMAYAALETYRDAADIEGGYEELVEDLDQFFSNTPRPA
jgi:hypothetical protein